MSIFVPNNPGTVRFTSGSTAITGNGTLFKGMRAGSTISIPGIGSMQLAADPTSDTAATGLVAWGAATTALRAYEYHARNEEGVFTDTLIQTLQELRGGNIQALAGLVLAANKLIKPTGAGTLALQDFAPWAQSLLALTGVANRLPYLNAANTAALTVLSDFARTILDDASAAAVLATLGIPVVSGTSELTLKGTTGDPTVSAYAARTCHYWKVGPLVYFNAQMRATVSAGGTGQLAIAGLPFAANASSNLGAASMALSSLLTGDANASLVGSEIRFLVPGSGSYAASALTLGANNYLNVSGVYLTNA